jgi:uncharacterized membrane protein YvbJ
MFCSECSCENIETDKRCVRCGVNLFQNYMDLADLSVQNTETDNKSSPVKEAVENIAEETMGEIIGEVISQGAGAIIEGIFSGL